MMQKSQVLHHSENGGNPGTSMMHNSDAQSEHDLRLRARLFQRAGSDRKSVVSGKRVSVSVDIGGSRIIKKTNISTCESCYVFYLIIYNKTHTLQKYYSTQ